MLKRKIKSPNYNSGRNTSQQFPNEMIEQVYKITYALLKWKYRDYKLQDSEVEEKATEKRILLLKYNNILSDLKVQRKDDFDFYLYKNISTKLNITITK